jgi:PAS domain S-box-containing protein
VTPKRFQTLLWLSLAVPAILMVLMASVVAFEVSELRQALDWVDHTDNVIAEARAALRRIVDAESGLRGYLVTGEPEFLQPWQPTSKDHARFARLEEMVSDNPAQRQRFVEIEAKFLDWMNYSKQMIQLRASRGNYADIQLNLDGKRRIDDIRSSFKIAIDTEQDLRDERIRRVNELDREFKFSLAGLSLVLVTTLVLFSRYQLHSLAVEYGAALRTSEERAAQERERKQWFFTLLRSVGDAVIATDADGRITFINPAAEAATGWSEAEAKTQPLETVFRIVNADTRDAVENPVDKVRRMNSVVGLANHTILIRKDGTDINIDDSGAPIRDDAGRMIGIILVFRDITKQYEMERTLRTTERLALAGRIAASVAHEIYNPLDTLGNLLHLIQNDSGDHQSKTYVEMAAQELKRVNQVTRSMLSLYRESQTPVTVALADVFNNVLSLLDMQIRNKEAEIVCEVPQDITVEGFPAELRQVFTNLIHNALDAIPQYGRITIEVTSPEPHKIVCIAISDNGCGISSMNMPRLFQPLFTTKGQNGTGLGLWVSKGIIEKHGGSIEATTRNASDSPVTTFTIVLPQRFPAEILQSKAVDA